MIKGTDQYQRIYQQRGWSFVDYWLSYTAANRADYAALDQKLPNLLSVRTWLVDQEDHRVARLLLNFVKILTPYLRQRERAETLVNFCHSGLSASAQLGTNPGWLRLLRHEAYDKQSSILIACSPSSDKSGSRSWKKKGVSWGRGVLQTMSNSKVDEQTIYEAAGRRFSRYYRSYAEDYRDSWIALQEVHPNLLTACRYCREAQDHIDLIAFRNILKPHLDAQGLWEDCHNLNDWAIEAAHALNHLTDAAQFTQHQADLLNQRGMYPQARGLYAECEERYLALGEDALALESRHMRSMVVRAQGQLTEAEALCEATLRDARNLGLDAWLGHPLYVRALLARDRGDFQQARRFLQESLHYLAGRNEELVMIGQCYYTLGDVAYLQGQLTEAREALMKSLELSQVGGTLRRVAACQRLLGDIARAEGRAEEAARCYREAYTTTQMIGDQPQLARVQLSRGQLMMSQRRLTEAIGFLQNTLALYQQIGDPRGVVAASMLLVWVYLRRCLLRYAIRQVFIALQAIWRARLVRPKIVTGILRRWGRW